MLYELTEDQVRFIGASIVFTTNNSEELTPEERQAAIEIMSMFFQPPEKGE